VLDEAILRRASAHANRLGFLLDSLRDLDSGLRNAGGALVLRAGPWAETVLATAQAAHFMRHLVDADVACNQLNWQWVAGTGTDTNRHRIFNPARQGKRFDPAGGYIRRWVPELAGLPAPDIHDPGPAARRARGYPEPIVDHRQAMAAHRARRAGR
jgi:deoxyribodipyrimidine photo-lyase